MVAVMAVMEAPAIIVGVMLMRRYEADDTEAAPQLGPLVQHSFTNGSVLMVLGSLAIGLIAGTKQADGIKPFTTDIFKEFLAIFLLEMGMVTTRYFTTLLRYGRFVMAFAVLVPLLNGCVVAVVSHGITESVGNRFIFAILAASASYVTGSAAMRLAAPKADPGLYLPMALEVTFPFNITLGMPLYFALVQYT